MLWLPVRGMFKTKEKYWVWWYMSVMPALRRMRQEDLDFKSILGYSSGPYFKNQMNKNQKYNLSPAEQSNTGVEN
jgi:hypothetical protein